MPHAEHPLVAPHGTNAAPHLVREGLEGEPIIRRRQRAGNAVAGALRFLDRKEVVDGLFEPALEQVFVAFERDQPARGGPGLERQMEPMDGAKEKQGADALVEILAAAPEGVQFRAFFEECRERELRADGVEGLIADGRGGRGDDLGESAAHFPLIASNSTSPLNTSSRSSPARARASWAVSRPYLRPRS